MYVQKKLGNIFRHKTHTIWAYSTGLRRKFLEIKKMGMVNRNAQNISLYANHIERNYEELNSMNKFCFEYLS